MEIAFGPQILRQPLESIQRIDKRLRHNEFISVSDRALEHRVFLSWPALSRRLCRTAGYAFGANMGLWSSSAATPRDDVGLGRLSD
jgi:hypothetical protein